MTGVSLTPVVSADVVVRQFAIVPLFELKRTVGLFCQQASRGPVAHGFVSLVSNDVAQRPRRTRAVGWPYVTAGGGRPLAVFS